MWTVLLVLYLWVVRSAVSSSLPSPVDVAFSSVNLKNVLHWSPGNGTPDGTQFTVKYAIYGDSVKNSKGRRVNWREARHCLKTPHTWCDLSNETWDLEQGYFARVRAVGTRAFSNWTWTARRFDPLSDTSFGPPLLSVERQDMSAILTMKGPMRYQPNNHTPVVSMATFYPHLTYNLSVHNTHRGQMHHFLLDTSTYTYQMMDYDTEYCFSAKTRIPGMPIHCHTSEWSCTTTPKDPVIEHVLKVIVGIVVPSFCICALVVICYFLCNYLTGKGHKSPYILNPPSFHSSPLIINNADNPNIIVITIGSSNTDHPAYTRQLNANCPDLPPRYSPPEPMESGDDLSLDYGVVAVDVTRADKDENELKGKCQRCEAVNRCEKKEEQAEGGQVAGFYSHQAQPRLPVTSTPICTEAQAHTWSQLNSGLLTQSQDRDCQGLFINKNPQTGCSNCPLNLQAHNDSTMENDMEGKVTDAKEDADRGSKDEKVPLLSTYAFQSISNMPVFDAELPHFITDDSDFTRPGAVDSVEEADDDYYGEEEGAVCINWDPDTRRLVVPEMPAESNKQRGREGERESGDMLRLENVFVRQSSEEAKEAEALMRRGSAGADCAMDDFVSRWKLVIPVDH